MRSLSILVFISIFTLPIFGQTWTQVDARSIPQRGQRNINPQKFITANVNDTQIKDILWSAPDELKFDPKSDQHTLIKIMLADGNIDEFSIVRYQMMEPGLAKRYDHIRTFHGLSTTHAARRIRINYTVHGLRATITDNHGQTYIDHFQRKDKHHKIIYRRNDFEAHEDWSCQYEEEKSRTTVEMKGSTRSGDCVFRSYRLSMTTTGEYSNYHGAFSEVDSSLVMSAVVTTVDRVNDVFEQDVTTRLILIDSVDKVFYYDPTSDPFSGSSSGSMITQNQTNTDSIIGAANYDLGHIVSTGGGGLAFLGVICANGAKASGVTGIAMPEGDPFDIDYVAHEMGHQLGANHTQNNACNPNNSTAMEPGSGSTIMGFAGKCSPNVQNNSDAYFHAISIQEINTELASNSCHQVISLSNVAPVVNVLTNKSIPHSTPFLLSATATDGDGDVLTYNWEQMDNEVGPVMPPAGTNAQGPMFRSVFATTDSVRYFPNITAITTGVPYDWEVLPTVDRNMDFRVTVRDNTFAPGCTDEQDITLDVVGTAGPFLVTSQNSATTWSEAELVTITWDVANTDLSPINCSHVDILLSYDGGLTYPTTIISATENDGSVVDTVPLGTSNSARIMVKCSDNVFFDINDTDITIEEGTPSFTINTTPSSGSVCDDLSINFTLESSSILGFSDPITLSVSDLPAGASSNIATNPISPGNNTLISIDNLDGKFGNFSIKITGVSGSITEEAFFDLTVQNASFAPTLLSPANGSTGTVTNPVLSWNPVSGAISYDYEVSTTPNGGNVINSGNTASSSAIISPDLELTTLYYWRVRSTTNCGITPWSADWTFETGTCIIKSANDLPIAISSVGTPTISSTFFIADKGVVTDLNIINLTGTHSYISDLNFTLILPDGTSTAFWSDPCDHQDDFDINFDDEAESNMPPCPPVDGLTYIPDNPLTIFDTKQIHGEWELSVFDDFDDDGGTLDSWGVEICLNLYCDLTVDDNGFTDTYGTLNSALSCALSGDTIFLESAIAGMTINTGSGTININENIVIIADPADSIKVTSIGNVPTFNIESGKVVTLVGFEIENVESGVGVLENNGTLTLIDMDVTAGGNLNSVINQNGGNLIIEGDCVITGG